MINTIQEIALLPRATILVVTDDDDGPHAATLRPLGHVIVARPADARGLLGLRDPDVLVLACAADPIALEAVVADAAALRPHASCLLLLRDGTAPDWADAASVTVAPADLPAASLRALCAVALRAARALRTAHDLAHENHRLREPVPTTAIPGLEDLGPVDRYETLLTRSPAMSRVLGALRRIEPTDSPLVIAGEMGCGRSAVAEAIHARSRRRSRPFCALILGGLPEAQREGALFGSAGAGAGALVEADGGTLFLDDVADASPALQSALLRILEDGTLVPPGSDQPRRVDVRLLSGTHRNLGDLVRQGLFRRDLYERLHAATIEVPPLRDRPEDVFVLGRYFLALASLAMGRKPPGISREARAALEGHPWPGNVRELRNVIERAAMLCKSGLVIAADLPIGWARHPGVVPDTPAAPASSVTIPLNGATLKQLEREIFAKTLALVGGNQSRAAQALGLCESTFRFKLHKLGIASRRTPTGSPQPAAPSQLAARG